MNLYGSFLIFFSELNAEIKSGAQNHSFEKICSFLICHTTAYIEWSVWSTFVHDNWRPCVQHYEILKKHAWFCYRIAAVHKSHYQKSCKDGMQLDFDLTLGVTSDGRVVNCTQINRPDLIS